MTKGVDLRRITDDGRIFVDMPDTPENPCLSCGACCQHYRVSFYCGELAGGSGGCVPDEMASKLNEVMACMKGTEKGGGRCIALDGDIGRPGIGCRIYAVRPTPCREFPTWLDDGTPNPDCQRLRAGVGLPPLLPIQRDGAPPKPISHRELFDPVAAIVLSKPLEAPQVPALPAAEMTPIAALLVATALGAQEANKQ